MKYNSFVINPTVFVVGDPNVSDCDGQVSFVCVTLQVCNTCP